MNAIEGQAHKDAAPIFSRLFFFAASWRNQVMDENVAVFFAIEDGEGEALGTAVRRHYCFPVWTNSQPERARTCDVLHANRRDDSAAGKNAGCPGSPNRWTVSRGGGVVSSAEQ